jgi:hypothetical protein
MDLTELEHQEKALYVKAYKVGYTAGSRWKESPQGLSIFSVHSFIVLIMIAFVIQLRTMCSGSSSPWMGNGIITLQSTAGGLLGLHMTRSGLVIKSNDRNCHLQ